MVKTLTRNLIALIAFTFLIQTISLPVHYSNHQQPSQAFASTESSLEVFHAQDMDCGLCATYTQVGQAEQIVPAYVSLSIIHWSDVAEIFISDLSSEWIQPSARAPPAPLA